MRSWQTPEQSKVNIDRIGDLGRQLVTCLWSADWLALPCEPVQRLYWEGLIHFVTMLRGSCDVCDVCTIRRVTGREATDYSALLEEMEHSVQEAVQCSLFCYDTHICR